MALRFSGLKTGVARLFGRDSAEVLRSDFFASVAFDFAGEFFFVADRGFKVTPMV